MITVNDQKEIAELKRDWECWALMAEQCPGREDFKKHADALELMIMNLEKE